MGAHRQHLELANERFDAAEEMTRQGKEHTAAHLYINAAINYHNALCQKYLGKIPSHKDHGDTSYFKELSRFLQEDTQKYKAAYVFLMQHKSQAEYGIGLSLSATKQIRGRASKIKEIAEPLI